MISSKKLIIFQVVLVNKKSFYNASEICNCSAFSFIIIFWLRLDNTIFLGFCFTCNMVISESEGFLALCNVQRYRWWCRLNDVWDCVCYIIWTNAFRHWTIIRTTKSFEQNRFWQFCSITFHWHKMLVGWFEFRLERLQFVFVFKCWMRAFRQPVFLFTYRQYDRLGVIWAKI